MCSFSISSTNKAWGDKPCSFSQIRQEESNRVPYVANPSFSMQPNSFFTCMTFKEWTHCFFSPCAVIHGFEENNQLKQSKYVFDLECRSEPPLWFRWSLSFLLQPFTAFCADISLQLNMTASWNKAHFLWGKVVKYEGKKSQLSALSVFLRKTQTLAGESYSWYFSLPWPIHNTYFQLS